MTFAHSFRPETGHDPPMTPETDDLTGEYRTNHTETDTAALYPSTMERVVVYEDRDGYFGVIGLDADGNIVARFSRHRERIAGALDGEPGYDIATYDV